MSQVIELSDDIFVRAKNIAEKEGVTPEVWIENLIDDQVAKDILIVTDEDRAEWHRYSKELDKKFGEILKTKFRRQGLRFGEK